MNDFMSMGAYTFYVWASVGSVLVVLGFMVWHAHHQFNRIRKAIAWSKHAQS